MSMFPFSTSTKAAPAPETLGAPVKTTDAHPLDALTHGAFSAHTSGERMACIREWLTTGPGPEQLQQVFKELSSKDKGAAKLLREKLDDIKRSKAQASIAQEWADKAQALLACPKLNLADALAWQRDAAKAGAPLSKEPLAGLKVQLVERVRAIEDLQHRVQVQREAAVLVAQRIEVLSTKPWRDAQAVQEALSQDVANWQAEAMALTGDANWQSVDAKFPTQLQASQAQLGLVWDAFQDALKQALLAAENATAALPNVPVWADELRAARGLPLEGMPKPAKPKIDPEIRAKATHIVREVLSKLELEVAQGHGKASAGAANALRNALKEHARLIDDKLENQANGALAAAGELEGWQRWRADQLRDELVAKAEGLLNRPDGQAIGGRKMQETLRSLREQWKLTDQGGVPNHALWKRFDDACNEAHKVVEVWLEKLKAETAEHRAQRLALIDEVKAWAEANRTALDDDWKGFNRLLHQFGDRWRDGGHVGEKLYAELQPMWKAAIDEAAAPLEALQKQSLTARHAMIDEAKVLGAEPVLHIDAVKSLQQRWQAEAHRVPIDRRQEQKLWDAFRKPIDEAFNRKTQEREKAQSALGERDRMVLDASKALQAANASGDAQAIRAAMAALDAALHGQAQAQAAVTAAAEKSDENASLDQVLSVQDATDIEASGGIVPEVAATSVAAEAIKPAPRKPVVAMRGDDRPGMKKEEPAVPGRGGKFGDRKDGPRTGGRETAGRGPARTDDRGPRRDARPDRIGGERATLGERFDAPRLGDSAFRAQRDALEQAQLALRKLSAQAHGEALTHLLQAWETRDAALVPSVQELGNRVSTGVRGTWVKALGQPPAAAASTALLRLEMAAELPTPADFLSDRRMLQLQLLTRRNDPAPAQTWGQDAAAVLASAFDAVQARRLQNVLKTLLKP
jgi:ATP-dependent RNA helicase SUPV3L1/SUV3